MTRLLPSRYILHRGVLIALGLLIVLLAVGSPDRASAQSAALVSNIGETTAANADFRTEKYAQEFTTGSSILGYTLTSVDLDMAFTQSNRATFSVAVHASSNGQPGNRLATLTAPGTLATGVNTFTHTGLDLAPSTSYFVVFDVTSTGTGSGIDVTLSDAESGASGWSINNVAHGRAWNSTGAWSTATTALKIGINGVAKGIGVLVTNFDRVQNFWGTLRFDYAQRFTTGSNPTGYTLTSVDLNIAHAGTVRSTVAVAIYTANGNQLGTKVGDLTAPQAIVSGRNTFTHSGLDLAAPPVTWCSSTPPTAAMTGSWALPTLASPARPVGASTTISLGGPGTPRAHLRISPPPGT